MLGIARSRSEKRITLPPNRWNRITSFHLPSKRRSAASTSDAADEKYRYVLQTINAQTCGDKVTVHARLTGQFLGSPIELDHIFKLSNNKIASLEIRS